MNEPTPAASSPSSADQTVPVSVPAAAAAAKIASPPDQLPTARVPAISLPLPPPVPPPGPAYKTQPLRALGAPAAKASSIARAWSRVVTLSSRAASTAGTASTERRVGVACVALGLVTVVGALASGWHAIDAEPAGDVRGDRVALAAALVLARVALAIAATAVGFGLLRIGERSLRAPGNSAPSAR